MRTPVIMCALCALTSLCVLSGDSLGAGDEIGLYFDSAGTINCLPGSIQPNVTVSAFLILKNCTSSDGLGGWEAAFSMTPGIFLLGVELPNATAINVGTFPEFVVGLAEPIASSPSMLLATAAFFVAVPGEVFLHAVARSSVAGSLSPVYTTGTEPSRLVKMAYSYGGPLNAAATIGMAECPLDSLYQSQLQPQELPLISGNSSSNLRKELLVEPGSLKQLGEPNWRSLWLNSDVGVRGEISSIETGCLEDHDSNKGVIRIAVTPIEVYWGPQRSEFTFWIEGVDVPNCMSYGENFRFGAADELEVGDEVLSFGQFRDGTLWSGKWHFLAATPGKASSVPGSGIQQVRSFAASQELDKRVRGSDVLAMVQANPSIVPAGATHYFGVLEVFFGRDKIDSELIGIKFPAGFAQFVGATNADKRLLCLLTLEEDGVFRLTDWGRSIFVQGDQGFSSLSGMPVDVTEMLE